MSTLGDLLLAHLKPKAEKVGDESDPPLTPPSSNVKETKIEDSSSHNVESATHKVFPDRIEKNIVEDTQSNASSTDDYVRELLDPDDRPRNVWHVVEEPKVELGTEIEPHDDNNDNDDNDDYHHRREVTDDGTPPPQSELLERDDQSTHHVASVKSEDQSSADQREVEGDPVSGVVVDKKGDHNDDRQDDKRDDEIQSERSEEKHRSRRDKSHKRSSSSRHRHHDHDRDKDHDRVRERDRDKNRDRDRHRSDRDSHDYDRERDRYRSSKRKHEYSDDDDRRRTRDRRRSGSRSRSSRHHVRSRSNSQSPRTKRNSRTILIVQLNPRVNSKDLEDFFSDIGPVREVRLIMDSKTRRHKGIAYIEFEDASSASKAFSLNGQDFFGAPVVIQSAQVEKNRPPSDWHSSTSHTVNHATSHSSSRSYLPPNSYRVYVGGLHVQLTEDMIRSIFEPFGPIIRLELMKDRVTNVSRGYAFITYANIEDGQEAVKCLDGFELAGKALRVSKSTDKSERHTVADGGGRSYHDSSNQDDRSGRSRDLTASLYELAGH